VDLDVIDFQTTIKVLTTMIIDDNMSSNVARTTVRQKLDEIVTEQAAVAEFLAAQNNARAKDDWGRDPHHTQGLDAARNIVGGPAASLPQ
jgi:hypothetical protein